MIREWFLVLLYGSSCGGIGWGEMRLWSRGVG